MLSHHHHGTPTIETARHTFSSTSYFHPGQVDSDVGAGARLLLYCRHRAGFLSTAVGDVSIALRVTQLRVVEAQHFGSCFKCPPGMSSQLSLELDSTSCQLRIQLRLTPVAARYAFMTCFRQESKHRMGGVAQEILIVSRVGVVVVKRVLVAL